MQQQWESGSISKIAPPATKPITSVRFGQNCEYTSEAKATYTGKEGSGGQNDDRNIYKDKFQRGNILLNAGNNQNDMKSVSMTEAQHRSALLLNSNLKGPGTNPHNARDFA